MTTSAKVAHATLLQYGDDTPAPATLYYTVAEVVSLEPGEFTDEVLDATSMDSTAVERIPAGCIDNGSVAVSINYASALTQTAMRDLLVTPVLTPFQICWPNWGARTVTFTVNTSNEQLSATTHGLTIGQPVRVSSTTTLPAGLSANTTYYARYVDANTLTLHLTNADAVAGANAVDITSAGTGTHTLQIGTRCSFSAWPSNFKNPPGTLRGKQVASFTLAVSGATTTTP